MGCTPPKASLFDRSIAESFERESSQSSRGRPSRIGCAEWRKRGSRPGFEPFPLCAREPAFLPEATGTSMSRSRLLTELFDSRLYISARDTPGVTPRPKHMRATTRNNSSVRDIAVQRGRHDVENSKQDPAKLFCSLSPKYARNHLLLLLERGCATNQRLDECGSDDDAWIGRKPQACKSRLLHPAKAPKHPGSLRESNWCLTCDRIMVNRWDASALNKKIRGNQNWKILSARLAS